MPQVMYEVSDFCSGKVEETEYPQNYYDLAGGQSIYDAALWHVVNELYPLAGSNQTFHRIVQEIVLKALNLLAETEANGFKFACNSTGSGTIGDEPIRDENGKLNIKAVERVLGQWQVHPFTV